MMSERTVDECLCLVSKSLELNLNELVLSWSYRLIIGSICLSIPVKYQNQVCENQYSIRGTYFIYELQSFFVFAYVRLKCRCLNSRSNWNWTSELDVGCCIRIQHVSRSSFQILFNYFHTLKIYIPTFTWLLHIVSIGIHRYK